MFFASRSQKKPFAVKLILRHSLRRITFPQAMAMLLEASPYKEQTHLWIADNAFGSMKSLETLSAMNCQVLLSVRKGFLGTTGALLDSYCTKGGAILICKPSGVFLTMSAVKEQNRKKVNKRSERTRNSRSSRSEGPGQRGGGGI